MFVVVVLDTNQWFHSTVILGINISIAIGSEYDWSRHVSILCISSSFWVKHGLQCEGVVTRWHGGRQYNVGFTVKSLIESPSPWAYCCWHSSAFVTKHCHYTCYSFCNNHFTVIIQVSPC